MGLERCLSCENESLVELHFGTDARWFVRRSSFRQQGIPHTLVALSDVSRALREEERRAWQRLIRVLGHELNNSLAPIRSIVGSLHGSKHSETQQQIVFSWKTTAEDVIISIQDDGPGLMNPGNAFVPFYSTKPAGSGIGLVLSRQIAEAHGGSLELSNRTDQRGCLVRVILPMKMAQAHDLAGGLR